VYTLARVGDSSLEADGHALSAYGKIDILLSSFTCDGVYRWSKVIGNSLDSEVAVSGKADAAGGIHVCGSMALLASSGGGGGHIGTDTVLGGTAKTMFLAKYDIGGNYQWLRMPQPDTIGHRSATLLSRLLDMDTDDSGNIHLMAYLSPG